MTDVLLFGKPNLPLSITDATPAYSRLFGSGDYINWSTHLEWTGTLNGTLTLWASNKPNPSEADDTDWVQVTLPSGMAGPAGVAGSNFCEVGNSGAKAYRLKFVGDGATSGTLAGWAHAKGC